MQNLLAALNKIKGSSKFILDEFPQLIFLIDEQGTFLDFFSASEAMLAVSPETIIGKTLSQLFPPSLAEQAMVKVKYTLQTGEETSFEYELPLSHGVSHFQARLIQENKNSVVAFIKDITQWHELQQRDAKRALMIEETEQRFKLLAENLPGAVYLCDNDADYSMLYLNSKVIDVTGYTPDEFISKKINFPDIYHQEHAAAIYQCVEESITRK
ncbi:MAG TPA: hypothetical protein DGG95_12820, partial [Cytophagales bacterium]|nr:hypothetical protein [Cytophagales bacterium]